MKKITDKEPPMKKTEDGGPACRTVTAGDVLLNLHAKEQLRIIRENAKGLEKTMRCFCDLDRWEPERSSGHSWVCPIHKRAVAMLDERGRGKG